MIHRFPCEVYVIVIFTANKALSRIIAQAMVTAVASKEDKLVRTSASEGGEMSREMALCINNVERTIMKEVNGTVEWPQRYTICFGT